MRELIGPRTEVVDLRGKLLIPGFQDAHVHPVGGGVELGQCDLSGATTLEAYRERVRAYALRHPDIEWITGGGWAMEAFPGGLPTAHLLDELVPDRPVYLVNRDHHGAWVNSRALEYAGIDARTPDPADGRIERGPDGVPTGMLQEGAANLVGVLLPPLTRDELVTGLLRAQELLHSLGVTAWQDALLGSHANLTDPTPAYLATADDGRLTARVVGALWWDRARGTEQIENSSARRTAGTRGRLRCTTVKIMQDGVAENGTAALLSVPGRLRLPHRQQRHQLHTAEGTAGVRHRTRRARLPGALPRPRRPGRARGPGRGGGGPADQRPHGHPAAPRAPPGWSTPTTSAASRSWARPPTCSRCGPRTSRRWTS